MKMKRIVIVVMCIAMILGMLPVFASGSDETAQAEDMTRELAEAEQINKGISIFLLVGAVIGALLVITLLYKKKDELRYL